MIKEDETYTMTERDDIMNRLYTSLKTPDVIKNLNEFHGDVKLLHQFIKDVEEIIELCNEIFPKEEPTPTIFIKAIRNKIKGEANQALINADTETTWRSIKLALIDHYSNPRSEVALIRDLHRTRQGSLTSRQLYLKILEIQPELIADASIHTKKLETKRVLYKEMCLAIFISNLREPLGSNIRSRDPETLTEAMTLCTSEENMYYMKYQPTFRKPPNNFKPNLNQNSHQNWQLHRVERTEQQTNQLPSTSTTITSQIISINHIIIISQPNTWRSNRKKNINITEQEPPEEQKNEQEEYNSDDIESNEEFFQEIASDNK